MKKLLLFISIACILLSCSDNEKLGKGTVKFEFTQVANDFKSASVENPSNLLITIFNVSTKEKIDTSLNILKLNDGYIIEPIALVEGLYQVTKFVVIGDTNKVMYACPKSDSELATLVTKALPIDFEIVKDVDTNLSIEVLSAVHLTPESFGYLSIDWVEVATFDILISPYVITASGTEHAKVKFEIIGGSDWQYSDSLLRVTNVVMVKDGLDTYTINITKHGYLPYKAQFSNEELRKYFSEYGPLIVSLCKDSSLNKDLIANYTFSGNANDETGNGFNGIVHGASLTTDKLENENSAYNFDGIDDYIISTSSFNFLNGSELSIVCNFLIDSIYQPFITKNVHICHFQDENQTMTLFVNRKDSTLGFQNYNNLTSSINIKINSITKIDLHKWYQLCLVIDKAKIKSTLYLNTKEEVTDNEHQILFTGDSKLVIGKHTVATETELSGKIDEFKIYERALSEEDIEQLYY